MVILSIIYVSKSNKIIGKSIKIINNYFKCTKSFLNKYNLSQRSLTLVLLIHSSESVETIENFEFQNIKISYRTLR